MPRYFVAFGQFFNARDKRDAEAQAVAALWGTRQSTQSVQFGTHINEVPGHKGIDPTQVCIDTDPTTGLKHWEGSPD